MMRKTIYIRRDLDLHVDVERMKKHETTRTTSDATYKPKVATLPS